MFGKKKNGRSQASGTDYAEQTMYAILQKIHTDAAKVGPSGSMTSAIKECFDQNEWKYDYDSEKDAFLIRFTGDNMQVRIVLASKDRALFSFTESDFNMNPQNYSKILSKINELNSNIKFGSFFLDDEGGRIFFRCCNYLPDEIPSSDFIGSFVGMLLETYDKSGLKEVADTPAGKSDNNPMFN